jgi:hypothetical protein
MNRSVRLSASLVAGAGIAFLIENLFLIHARGAGIVYLPIAMVVLDIIAATLIVFGNKTLRTGVLLITGIGVLVDVVVVLGAVPGWLRVVTGVLALAQVAALVLLNTEPVRAHFDTAQT